MQRKVFYGSIVSFAFFLFMSLFATYYNYASEIWIIAMIVCGIVCLITGVCKENVGLAIAISIGAFILFLTGFMMGMCLLCFLSALLFFGWLVGKKFLFNIWKKKHGEIE